MNRVYGSMLRSQNKWNIVVGPYLFHRVIIRGSPKPRFKEVGTKV